MLARRGRRGSGVLAEPRPLSTVLNELRPGDDVALLSLLDGRPHFASVVALEPVRAVAADSTAQALRVM
ncbi:MAG: hypothetical protein IIC80_09375 [Chloroflexi bacterium]|nr:hypothetical protein [Chloroflexota bacterium]